MVDLLLPYSRAASAAADAAADADAAAAAVVYTDAEVHCMSNLKCI